MSQRRQGKIRDRRFGFGARPMYFNTLGHRQSDTLSASNLAIHLAGAPRMWSSLVSSGGSSD
jgi:hypothetical protein